MEILQEVWKQHLRPRAVVGYGVKVFFLVLQITSPDHLEVTIENEPQRWQTSAVTTAPSLHAPAG